jgi:hypothetical protein
MLPFNDLIGVGVDDPEGFLDLNADRGLDPHHRSDKKAQTHVWYAWIAIRVHISQRLTRRPGSCRCYRSPERAILGASLVPRVKPRRRCTCTTSRSQRSTKRRTCRTSLVVVFYYLFSFNRENKRERVAKWVLEARFSIVPDGY